MLLSKFLEVTYMEASNIMPTLNRLTVHNVFRKKRLGKQTRWHINDKYTSQLIDLILRSVPYDPKIDPPRGNFRGTREYSDGTFDQNKYAERRKRRGNVVLNFMRHYDSKLNNSIALKIIEKKKAVEKAIIVLNQLKEVLEKNGCKIKHLSAPITVIGRGSGKVMFKL